AVLHVELWEGLERLLEGPCLVDVALQRQLGDGADRTHALDVEAVAAAELQLQTAEPRRGLLGTPRHVVRVAEPDRPARRRPFASEAEEPPHRKADELALQIVEGGVDRSTCGPLPVGEA